MIGPGGAMLGVGRAKLVGGSLQGRDAGVVGASPDLGLPERVAAFDVGLEACFARRREDGCDAQAQAEADDFTNDVGPVVWALETGVVVELRVGGQAVLAPVRVEAFDDPWRGDALPDPGAHQRSGEALGGESVAEADAFDGQVFDDTKGIRLRLAQAQGGKMPSRGRSRAAEAPGTIEQAVTGEHSGDGADGGHLLGRATQGQGVGDGLRADETQIALGGQAGPQFADAAGAERSGRKSPAGAASEKAAMRDAGRAAGL